jgi:hypothetical protein
VLLHARRHDATGMGTSQSCLPICNQCTNVCRYKSCHGKFRQQK